MIRFKLKAPWYYLVWRPSLMDAESEIAIANLTRRRGIGYMLRLFCGIVSAEEWRYTLACVGIFVRQNYPGVILAAAWLFGVPYCGSVCIGWLVTVAFGIAKFAGWLVSLLNRWPPLAAG